MLPPLDKGLHQTILEIVQNLRFRYYVVALSHSNYVVALGGTEKVLHEEQRELGKRGISYLQVYPYEPADGGEGTDQTVGVNVDSVSAGNLRMSHLAEALRFLHTQGLTSPVAVHVHHLLNFSIRAAKDFVHALPTRRRRIFLHDYYTVCPQINLLKDNKTYCASPAMESKECGECMWNEKRRRHFPLVDEFFSTADAEFITPSTVAASIWSRSFPRYEPHLRVVPHQIVQGSADGAKECPARLDAPDYRPRIAYLGYESFVKGLEFWWELTSHRELKGKYEFYHLGASSMSIPGITFVPVSFLEQGPDAMVKSLREHRIDIAFLWSLCPETYSFTVHEALAANCFVLTKDSSGNIAEVINGSTRGIVLSSEAGLIGFLKDVAGVKHAVTRAWRECAPCELAYNPLLTEELVEGLDHTVFSYTDDQGENIFHKDYLASTFGLSPARTTPAQHLEEELARLRLEIAHYRNSNAYRVIAYVKEIMYAHPRLGRWMRRVVSSLWNMALAFRGGTQKYLRKKDPSRLP